MIAAPKEVRAARAWLRKRGITTPMISPKRFASAAKELNKSFRETLALLARLYMGGQGEQLERKELIRKSVEAE